MAAYNFPNSPSDGDTVTSNGITYTYSSSKTRWDGAAASGSSTTVYATIDDLPLSGASTGDQAFVEGNNRLYIWNGTGWYNIALINTTPSISGASASYDLATDGTATTVTITATDPEGLPITYSIASDTSGNVATVTQGTGANTNVFTITPSTNTANAGTFSLTFRASDGVNIATAVSEFTLLFLVENSNYTTALITSVGANNAVNNSFSDASTNNHTITANGNVTQGTFSPYRHGGYSTYFDGAGDFLRTGTSSISIGTGDFTMEAWVYPAVSSQSAVILDTRSGSFNNKPAINYVNSTFRYFASSADRIISAASYPANAWYHCVAVRNSGTTTLYVNGVSEGTYADTTDYGTITRFEVGADDDGSENAFFKGNLSDVRFINGTAVYTSAFTPPTERLTAITNTSLLTCHLPYIADGSTNDHSITVNGNTTTKPFSPYDHGGYSTGDNGGSMYFDGSGDYLSIPNATDLQLGATSAFTAEFWLYIPAGNTDYSVLLGKGYNTGSAEWYLELMADGAIDLFLSYNGTSYATIATVTPTLSQNMWHHIAFVRESTSTVKVYTNGTQSYSNTSLSNWNVSTGPVQVGGYDDGSATLYSNCYISDLRFVKGTAVYTSAFTPPTAPLTAITNTSLLLNGTDAAIIDKSQSVKTITLNGNVKSSTAQTKYLTSSMYFDGTGDYLTLVGSGSLIGNASAFTVEGWYFPDAASSGFDAIYADTSGYATAGRLYNNGGTLTFYWANTGSVTGSSGWTSGQWNHFAVTYDGTTLKVFIDGSQVASTTSASFSGTADLTISNSTYPAHGYMSDVRITKGLARYTSNFTSPTAALEG